MDASAVNSYQKLEKHLILLKEEYKKLQRNYNELEKKYSQILSSSPENGTKLEFSSFLARLALTVASLYGRSIFSDLSIKMGSKTMPAHKFVLNARSDQWNENTLAKVSELDWSDVDQEISEALLRWIYTDSVDLQHDRLSLGLLKVAHRFNLPALLGLCERALVISVGVRSCVKFYCVAEEVGATTLLDFCSGLISTHWNDLTPQDFEHMSTQLLLNMLKNKAKYPLHSAIRLLREDVVLLYLADESISQVNCFSDQGKLPLQMALEVKNLPIAKALIEIGAADVNACDANGYSLLFNAVTRCDEFSSLFLIENDCQLNFRSRDSGDTALHILSGFSRSSMEEEIYENAVKITKKILSRNPNVNIQNTMGKTPLHIAIENYNYELVESLLAIHNIDINLLTNNDRCALEISLLENNDRALNLANHLIKLGADANRLKKITNDNLLQVMASNNKETSAKFLVQHSNVDHVNSNGLTALHIASKQNLYSLVEDLLKSGASPNVQCNLCDLKSPLHLAVEANNIKVIETFVEYSLNQNLGHIDFNCKNAKGDSPLSLSLSMNRTDLVAILIKGGADVNARNGQDMTLLHQTILNHDNETAIFLLNNGADMNALTGDQESPLQLAIHCHLSNVVSELCKLGVALSTSDNKGDPPLWTALDLGHIEIASILVKNGADTDCWAPGPEGCQQTLLHRAIDENKEQVAIFLIKSQCDLDTPRQLGLNGEGGDAAKDKSSPMHLCCNWGLTKVLQNLMDHGANVNALDYENKTPLHIAIENQHDEIITILLCHPSIDLRLRDKNGNTPFASALNVRNHKAAQKILERLPNAAEQMDQRGRNFLHLAIMKDDLESVLFLIAIQVDINSRVHDSNQSTPLHLAATSKNEMITRNLILAGSRVNERNAVQKTPLHIAAERGNLAAMSALIQNAADYDAIDGDGNNALHIAVRCGNLGIVRELLTESRINAEAVNQKGRNPLHELCRVGEDITASSICELFLECMPKYPINIPDMDGNTPLLLAFMRGQAPLCKVLVKNGACLGAENREGVSIFTFKLATDQLLHNLLDQLPQESPWSESDLCQKCGSKFSLTMRKHHCRHCGRVLCSKCSNNDVPILKFGINKPVRVCQVCFGVLQGGIGTTLT